MAINPPVDHAVHHRLPRAAGLTLRIKASWGCGAFGVAILSNSVSALMLFYLTKIVGLAGWIAGSILMVSKLFDIVSDPLVGWWSDRHISDQGRRRPFLLWGSAVSTVALLLVFTVPLRGDRPAVWLYVLVVNMLYTFGYSLYNVPLLAMAPEMTDGFHERSVLQGWRVMFSSAATAVAGLGSGLVLGGLGARSGPGGRVVNSARDYAILAVIFAMLTGVGMIIAWRGTRRARFVERPRSAIPWRDQMASFFGNRPAVLIIGVKAAQLIGIASSSSALLFLLVEVLKRSPGELPLYTLPVLAGAVVATPILARLSKVIGKRGGYVIGAMATALSALSWIAAQPGEPAYFLALRGALTGVAFSGNVMFAMSMLNDAMEFDALRTGLRREGLYSAFYSFVEKFGNALGPAVVGAALSVAGFDKTASVTAANLDGVRQAALLGVAYVPTACAVVALLLLSRYQLSERALEDARRTGVGDRVP